MSPDELDFLAERARREREIAEAAADPAAARQHNLLAEEYDRRLAGMVPLGLQIVGKD